MKNYELNKNDRIRKRKAYIALGKNGKRSANKCFAFNYQRNTVGINRLGITASKKIGNAVTRNRIKRIIREYFRNHRYRLGYNIDINVIVRSFSGQTSHETLRHYLKTGFDSIKRKYDDSRSNEKTGTV